MRLFLTFILLCAVAPCAIASTYVDVGDDAYYILDRLEAEGVITSALLSTKPLSRKEVARLIDEAENDHGNKSEETSYLIGILKERFRDDIDKTNFIKPLDTIYGRYEYHDSDLRVMNYNNDGYTPGRGSNVRAGFISRAESKWASLYLEPELRYSEVFTDVKAEKAYGLVHFFGLDLIAGKDSQWWGPGYHGALLLTDNPEPLKMVRLTNPEPAVFPWIFKYIGPFRFDFFVSRLEKDRKDVSGPLLWGLRLDFKPLRYLELGLERTCILGGEGQSESLRAWWDSFVEAGHNDPHGPEQHDQRAGYDVKLTLPFAPQPLQLYLEADGEDLAGVLPSQWAYLAGVYLPRVAGLARLDLRGEFAINHVSGHPNVWYNHSFYTQGYTYKGRIIGHHMGTDSRDIFVETSWLIPERYGRIALSYDREEHNLSGAVREEKDEIDLKGSVGLTQALELRAAYGYGKVRNPGNITGADKAINTIMGEIRYRF